MTTSQGRSSGARPGSWKVHAVCAMVLAGVTALVYATLISPAHAHHDRVVKEKEAAQERARELATIEVSTRELESLALTMEKSLSESAELQPIQALNRRLADISTFVEESGLVLSQLSPGDVRTGVRHSIVPVRLQGTGSVKGVTRLIHVMHGALRDVEVTGLSIQSSQQGTGAVRFDLWMDWYTLAERANLGDRNGSSVAGAHENR